MPVDLAVLTQPDKDEEDSTLGAGLEHEKDDIAGRLAACLKLSGSAFGRIGEDGN